MKVITIGRGEGNNIVINDSLVSRSHCQIIKDNNGNYRLIDNNSANGTCVIGVKRHGEVRLNQSDIVRIGNTTLPWQTYFKNAARTETGIGTIVDRGGYGYPQPEPQKGGGFGVAALICGIFGFNLLAIIFGIIGWQRDRKNRGLAIAGFILGCVWIVVCIILIIIANSAVYGYYY
jgi:hypothetical protein